MLAGELYDPLDPELVTGRELRRRRQHRAGTARVLQLNCVVLDVCPVRIGDFTLFGPAVQMYTPMHPLNAELRRREEFGKPVEEGVVAAGNPCRVVRDIT